MTIQRMIELLEIEHECMLRGAHDDCDRNCADCELVQDDWELHEMYTNVISVLKEQEPKTPIHIHEEYLEHDWETDEDGKIDEWAMEYEFHNGPMCKRCGYSFCIHCKPNGWNEKPCVIDYYQCPRCKERIYKGFENIVYCRKCGQAVKWE